jgi:ribosome-associated protein
VIMEMRRQSSFCDFFVIMSASSSIRVKAVVDHVEERLRKEGLHARHREGYAEASWVLLDYGFVVIHVFYPETRKYYDLENLWGDVPRRNYVKIHASD